MADDLASQPAREMPEAPEAMLARALELHRADRLADAAALYEQILDLDPENAEALRNLASIALQKGRFELALGLSDQALKLKPDSPEALSNRGAALHNLRRFDEAIASLDAAIALDPENGRTYADRSLAFKAAGQLEAALDSADRAIALEPDYAPAHNNRGAVLCDLNRPEEALASLDLAIALQPAFDDAHANRGRALHSLDRPDEALVSCERAIALRPGNAEAYNARGVALAALGRLDDAIASYDHALRLPQGVAAPGPDRLAEIHSNRGAAFATLGRLTEAMACYERALSSKPDHAEALFNKSLALLTLGRFDEGWRLYEWRKRMKDAKGYVAYPQAEWLGAEDISGKTVFLRYEQGLGDTLQFCRYAKLAHARGARVVMSVQDPLVRLLKQLEPQIEIIGEREMPAAFDLYAPLMSLPHAFGTTVETVPAEPRYLAGDPTLKARWRDRLPPRTRPRIGLVWSGNPKHKNDRNRSIALGELEPLLSLDAEWVSLQKEVREGDAETLSRLGRIYALGPELGDFADTAALIDELDLVLTVDTSIAHLAGALGKPVWVLLPYGPDFRWLRQREDSPWYPSARLFRQASLGDWSPVIAKVRDELRSRFAMSSAAAAPHHATEAVAEAADLHAMLQLASELRAQQHLTAAQNLYQQVLARDPHHAEAALELGLMAQQAGRPDLAVGLLGAAAAAKGATAATQAALATALNALGRFDEAVRSYDRAIALDPNNAKAHNGCGNALQMLGRLAEALVSYANALALDPDYMGAHHNRANTMLKLERLEEAVDGYSAAIRLQPDLFDAHNNRGVALAKLGRPAEAVASYEQAIALRPDHPEARLNMALALHDLGRFEEALASYDTAIALKPDFGGAYSGRGATLHELGRVDEAMASYDRAIVLQPGLAEAHNNRAMVLHDLGQLDAALAVFETAIALNPDLAEAHSGRGVTLHALGRTEEALASYEKAVAVKPDLVGGLDNRRWAVHDQSRLEEALASFDEALKRDPDLADAAFNKSLTLLTLGRFDEGWPLYEARKRKREPLGSETYAQPHWMGGEDIGGKTVFLHWEQGFGDTLQFCRYAWMVRDRGARVVISAQDALVRLLRQWEPEIEIIGGKEAPQAFDFHAALLSLPLAFRTTMESIPARPRYLEADPQLVARWADRLPPRTRPRVGLVWSGNPKFKGDMRRSMKLEQLAPLLSADVEWFSLQKDVRERDAETLARFSQLNVLGPMLDDFAEAAAAIDQMDLVVTSDTSVAHLAGALGKPVWVLLAFLPDFRWFREGEDCPWYPSARLFRQPRPGDWPSVVARVRDELAARFF
ncbi:MAG TPA: tetratricopeptide repeat protein [Caulobacteraceae bacterium]|nr:tetratricopeptide repeat protein [Caulobacteraceae bacterium]